MTIVTCAHAKKSLNLKMKNTEACSSSTPPTPCSTPPADPLDMKCVYLLVDPKRRTYIGATVDLRRRLRQHNCEITGGARRTSRISKTGMLWQIAIVVCGFSEWRDALRFESAWRRACRRPRGFGVEWRTRALEALMRKERWSSTSPLAVDVPLTIHTFTSAE